MPSEVQCNKCDKLFKPARRWQIFCSALCRKLWYAEAQKAAAELVKTQREEEMEQRRKGSGT